MSLQVLIEFAYCYCCVITGTQILFKIGCFMANVRYARRIQASQALRCFVGQATVTT